LATLCFAVGLHDTLVTIHKKVKEQYPDATDADLVGAFAWQEKSAKTKLPGRFEICERMLIGQNRLDFVDVAQKAQTSE